MFSCAARGGKYYNEGQEIDAPNGKKALTWEDIPKDVRITGLQLLYPFPVKFRRGEEVVKEEKPKLSISNFHRYYFFNESTVPLLMSGDSPVREGIVTLEAKIIGAIDDKARMVLEYRMDKWGNVSVDKFELSRLERRINDGVFRAEIIRSGDID